MKSRRNADLLPIGRDNCGLVPFVRQHGVRDPCLPNPFSLFPKSLRSPS